MCDIGRKDCSIGGFQFLTLYTSIQSMRLVYFQVHPPKRSMHCKSSLLKYPLTIPLQYRILKNGRVNAP